MKPIAWAALALTLCACDVATQPARAPQAQMDRFKIYSVPGSSQSILLDSQTGETWYRVTTGGSDIEAVTEWLPMDKVSLRDWIDLNQKAAKPPG